MRSSVDCLQGPLTLNYSNKFNVRKFFVLLLNVQSSSLSSSTILLREITISLSLTAITSLSEYYALSGGRSLSYRNKRKQWWRMEWTVRGRVVQWDGCAGAGGDAGPLHWLHATLRRNEDEWKTDGRESTATSGNGWRSERELPWKDSGRHPSVSSFKLSVGQQW